MISIKLERAIFIIIFVICLLTCVYFSTQIKYELPINKGLTAEQVIETKYKGQEYKYKIYDDIMFVCIKNENGDSELDYAFRNENSGFMFKIPGFFAGTIHQLISVYDIVQYKDKVVSFIDNEPFIASTIKMKSKYYVTITDSFNKIDNVEFYKDGEKLVVLSIGDAKSQYWVCELEDLSEFNKIEGFYKGEKLKIVNINELNALIKEGQQ